MLNESLTNQMNQAILLWNDYEDVALKASVEQWGYNDTGLICAQLRARGEHWTKLAKQIEAWRLK